MVSASNFLGRFSNREEGGKKKKVEHDLHEWPQPATLIEHRLLRGDLARVHAHSLCQHSTPGPQLLCQAWYAQVITKMVPSPNILQSNWLLLHLK